MEIPLPPPTPAIGWSKKDAQPRSVLPITVDGSAEILQVPVSHGYVGNNVYHDESLTQRAVADCYSETKH